MEALLGAMRGDVERARSRVWIEAYIYRDDRFGHAFANRLARAAARGADVRLLYDALGSNKSSARFFATLQGRGIDARPYRPLDVVLRAGMWPRTHARVVVLDGRGYVGGAAFGDEWLPSGEGGGGWHEVCVRVDGPAVRAYADVFLEHWANADAIDGHGVVLETAEEFFGLELVSDSPLAKNAVYARHLDAFRAARRRVWVENAYFAPPPAMRRALLDAAARGVDVRVVVPGPTDLPSVQHAGRAHHEEWIRGGIRVFEYQPNILHAKFALVDDGWATVGTFNANPTSLRWANEVNLFVRDRRFVAQVASLFERDVVQSREVTPDSLRGRAPLEALRDAAWDKVLGLLGQGA
jgi:cardiolipin synthase